MSLDFFFSPRSIAVVGASHSLSKAGGVVLHNLLTLGYRGNVYPVNPREQSLFGVPCYSEISAVPGPLDLVILCVPAALAVQAARQTAQRGDVKGIVVLSAGFSELGTEEGRRLEQELKQAARAADIRVIGPNCVGLINTAAGINATFHPPVQMDAGKISVLSQSGAMGASIVLYAQDQPQPLALGKETHVGNMCDVSTLEILEEYGRDPDTAAILWYMEGFSHGRAMMEAARRIVREKPILALKVGRNALGAQAAFSHTGSLAGQDELYEAAFRRCGILRAESIPDLIDGAKALTMQPLPQGGRIAILTEAGGPGSMAMDELGRHPELCLAHISREGCQSMEEQLHPMACIARPDGYVDITAAAMEKEHCAALECLLREEEVDGVVLISVPPTFLPAEDLAEALIKTLRGAKKPVAVCLLAGQWVRPARRMLEQASIPTFDTPEQAVRALGHMVRRSRYLREETQG